MIECLKKLQYKEKDLKAIETPITRFGDKPCLPLEPKGYLSDWGTRTT